MKNLPNKSTRMLIAGIALLVLTNVATLLWIQIHPHSIEKRSAEYPLIDPARNLVAQEDFITNIQPLRNELYQLFEREKLEHSMTLYFEVLGTGANISINQDFRVYPASLLKVPTAMAAMKKIERGEWKLDNKLVLFEHDVDPDYGHEYRNAIGTTFTIEELLKKSLIESDNTSNRILLRNLSIDELAEALDSMGLNEMLDENRQTTAREYSRLFRALYYSSFLQREHSHRILAWLTESSFDDYLASGIPAAVLFAHKIGEDDQHSTYLDSGIVYAGNRGYLLTVAFVGKSEEEAKALMEEISRTTYDYVSNY